jgi:hypothetical protein
MEAVCPNFSIVRSLLLISEEGDSVIWLYTPEVKI